jgi:hypothetical protein
VNSISYRLLSDILFCGITQSMREYYANRTKQNIFILLQSTKAIASKKATSPNVSRDKLALNGRWVIFIYLFVYLFMVYLTRPSAVEPIHHQ